MKSTKRDTDEGEDEVVPRRRDPPDAGATPPPPDAPPPTLPITSTNKEEKGQEEEEEAREEDQNPGDGVSSCSSSAPTIKRHHRTTSNDGGSSSSSGGGGHITIPSARGGSSNNNAPPPRLAHPGAYAVDNPLFTDAAPRRPSTISSQTGTTAGGLSTTEGPPPPPTISSAEEGLVEAQPIEELEQGEVVQQLQPQGGAESRPHFWRLSLSSLRKDRTTSSSVHDDDHRTNEDSRRQIGCLVSIGLLVMMLLLVIGIPLIILGASGKFNNGDVDLRSEEDDPEGYYHETAGGSPPGVVGQQQSPEEYLQQLLPPETLANIDIMDMMNTDMGSINVTKTPQSLAFEWLVQDPSLTLYSHEQLKQRFALATFYYATTNNGTHHQPWINDKHWLSYNHHECEWSSNLVRIDRISGNQEAESACDNYTTTNPTAATTNPTTILSPVVNHENYHYVRLWQSNNNLQGTIPEELYWLSHLQSIAICCHDVGFGGTLSTAIGHLSRLTDLSIKLAATTTTSGGGGEPGVIPTELAALTDLARLSLFGPQLKGTIPIEVFQRLTNLQQLGIGVAPFVTGSLPSQIGQLTNLISFSVVGTGFNGTLPTELGLLKHLTYNYFFRNRLTGRIPTQIGTLTNLAWLSWQQNQLTGNIPEEFYALTNLQELRLHSNYLTGSISSHIGNITKLYEMEFKLNMLSSTIPSEIGNLPIQELTLQGNQLTGSLPSELGNWGKGVEFLDLANNYITGSIPTSLQHFRGLKEARWNGNFLSGAIPSELGLWQEGALSLWDVSNNELLGSIPMELSSWWANTTGGFDTLRYFNVSGNGGLTGTIPNGLCKTLNASFLDFDCGDLLCGCDCVCQNGLSL